MDEIARCIANDALADEAAQASTEPSWIAEIITPIKLSVEFAPSAC